MPAPPEYHKLVAAKILDAIGPLLDKAWDEGAADMSRRIAAMLNAVPLPNSQGPTVGPPPGLQMPLAGIMSPQKRGAANRAPKGVVKEAIRAAVYSNPRGVSRDGVRKYASVALGVPVKEGSLKQGLRLLSLAKEVENRDRLWYPTKSAGQSSD